MNVYNWEMSISSYVRTLPRSGWFYDFMYLCSHFEYSKYLILIAIIGFIWWKGWRSSAYPILVTAIAVGLSDLAARRLVKPLFARPRPHFIGQVCNFPACWGFVSSHASNIAAGAAVLILIRKKNAIWTIPIVFLVGISRVYLLDHFPLDVLGGFALGAIIGLGTYKTANYFCGRKAAKVASTDDLFEQRG